ncbi:unnamed protein product, partial [Ectocarpus sp. 4 AP-2014]
NAPSHYARWKKSQRTSPWRFTRNRRCGFITVRFVLQYSVAETAEKTAAKSPRFHADVHVEYIFLTDANGRNIVSPHRARYRLGRYTPCAQLRPISDRVEP